MEQNNLWVLLGKQLNGVITEEERVVLQKLIREDERDLSYLIEFLEAEWKKGKHGNKRLTERELGDRWSRLSERLFDAEQDKSAVTGTAAAKRKTKFRRLSFWTKIAASLLILLSISFYYIHHRTSSDLVKRHTITVENGSKKRVVLPDGTSVWLNAGSCLSYNDGFAVQNRKVWLEGEAYFKVKTDASVPFMVETSGITVKVLGTVFNVRAYKDEPDIQTTLISGKVQVLLNHDPEKKVLLSPHEKLTVKTGKPVVEKNSGGSSEETEKNTALPVIPKPNEMKYQVQALPVNPADSSYFTETAWVENKLAFVYEPFEEVAKKMERRYNVHIVFKDEHLKRVVMSGVFDKETIGEALHVLQMLTRFHFRIAGDSVYLYK